MVIVKTQKIKTRCSTLLQHTLHYSGCLEVYLLAHKEKLATKQLNLVHSLEFLT